MKKLILVFIICLSSCTIPKHNKHSVKKAVDKTIQELIANKIIS